MRNYIIRRVLLMIPTLFLVTVVVFLTVRLIPGNVIEMMAVEHASTAGGEQLDLEAIREMLGMNVPWHTQYVNWIGGIISRGDFGDSLWTQPVSYTHLTLPTKA